MRAGDFIFVSGQVAKDEHGNMISGTIEVDTGVVPVAEVSLGAGDSVYFEHHAMLWKQDTVPMTVMSSPGGSRRLLGDMPFVLSVAHGAGRLAFSRDAAGALVVLPIDPGTELEVRGHGHRTDLDVLVPAVI